jgi:hypothetical protein
MIHANDEKKLAEAQTEILAAITWSHEPVKPLPHIYETIE